MSIKSSTVGGVHFPDQETVNTMPHSQVAIISLKMSPEFKEAIVQAAQLKMMSVNAYMINLAYENAKQVISEHETLRLSNEERDRFLALLENPPEPTEKAKMAMRKYLKGQNGS
jgi:uncharacterized protein (DUF1778 family)